MAAVDGALGRNAPRSRTRFRRSPIRASYLGRLRVVRYPCAVVVAAVCAVATPTLDARMLELSPSVPAHAVPSERDALVTYAKRFIGTPYRWGGAGPGGFDCSGLTSYVYAKFGVRMAHYTGAQFSAYRKVARGRLRPGDLVFFDGVGHMGIYVGEGRFIHATHSGDHVRISRLSEGWYAQRYSGAVRPPFRPSASSSSGPSMRKSPGMRSANSSASSA